MPGKAMDDLNIERLYTEHNEMLRVMEQRDDEIDNTVKEILGDVTKEDIKLRFGNIGMENVDRGSLYSMLAMVKMQLLDAEGKKYTLGDLMNLSSDTPVMKEQIRNKLISYLNSDGTNAQKYENFARTFYQPSSEKLTHMMTDVMNKVGSAERMEQSYPGFYSFAQGMWNQYCQGFDKNGNGPEGMIAGVTQAQRDAVTTPLTAISYRMRDYNQQLKAMGDVPETQDASARKLCKLLSAALSENYWTNTAAQLNDERNRNQDMAQVKRNAEMYSAHLMIRIESKTEVMRKGILGRLTESEKKVLLFEPSLRSQFTYDQSTNVLKFAGIDLHINQDANAVSRRSKDLAKIRTMIDAAYNRRTVMYDEKQDAPKNVRVNAVPAQGMGERIAEPEEDPNIIDTTVRRAVQPEVREAPVLTEASKTKISRKAGSYLEAASYTIKDDAKAKRALANITDDIAALNELTEKLSTSDVNGVVPVLTQETLDRLKSGYRRVLVGCGDLLAYGRANGMKENSALYQSINKVGIYAEKDLNLFNKINPDRKMTFPQLLQAAHTEHIAVKQENINAMHGQMSSRLPLKVTLNKNGKNVIQNGLFTESVTIPSDMELLTNVISSDERYRKLTADLLHNACRGDQKKFSDCMYSLTTDKRTKLPVFGKKFRSGEFAAWQSAHCAQGTEDCAAVKSLIKDLNRAIKHRETSLSSGIVKGSRVDQRNSAMSAVAELFGMPDLVATSVPMEIKRNGKVTKGTFMSFSELSDPRSLVDAEKFAKVEPNKKVLTAKALEQASDLQVLDFICGNVDRHGGNMFFKIEEDKIVGIQGIDNDMSFGVIDEENLVGHQRYHHFTTLQNMGFITASTALMLNAIHPSTLRMVLAPFNLSKKEVDAACNRLNTLKQAMNWKYADDPERFRAEKNHIDLIGQRSMVYVIHDDSVSALDINDLYSAKQIERDGKKVNWNKNIFSRAFGSVREAAIKAREYFKVNEAGKDKATKEQKELVESIDKAKEAVQNLADAELNEQKKEFNPQEYAVKLGVNLADLQKKNEGWFSGSVEYDNILLYTDYVQKQLAAMSGNEEDFRRTCTMMENLEALTSVYLDKKMAEGSEKSNSRSISRAMAVRDLRTSLHSHRAKMGESVRDCYCRLNTLQRAGAYRYKTDTRTIANYLRALKDKTGQTQYNDENLVGLLDGVTERAWTNVRSTYETEILRIRDMMKPECEEAKKLTALSDRIKTGEYAASAEGMHKLSEDLKAAAVNANPSSVHAAVSMRMAEVLGDRLGHDAAVPFTAKDQLAHRLIEISVMQKKGNHKAVQDPAAYKKLLDTVQKSDAFKAMTAGKNDKKILDMLKETNDRKLTERYLKAGNVKYQKKEDALPEINLEPVQPKN